LPGEDTIQSNGDNLRWSPGDVTFDLLVDREGPVRLRSVRPAPAADRPDDDHPVSLVELDCLAEGRVRNTAASQHRTYAVADSLRHTGHTEEVDEDGNRTLVVRQRDESRGLEVITRLQAWTGTGVIRVASEVINISDQAVTLTYVSSLALCGFGGGLRDEARIHQARNTWCAELRWQQFTPEEAGLVGVRPWGDGWGTTKGRYAVTTTGSWSSGDFLPMGAIENLAEGVTWTWQLEHQGSWHWELGDLYDDLYLQVSGPTDAEHQWRQTLAPGETFHTVPVAVAVTPGGLTDGLRALTSYRRMMRRPQEDNRALPVIFNDYMNCLMGDPTAERLIPLIEAAAEVGSEYFVIDAGWYSDGPGWWDTVGAWEPSTTRFPDGLDKTMQLIRDSGMKPGLWLEPEVIGVHSEVAGTLPADAFFTLDGRRVTENGRFHLDYRSETVRLRMDAVIDRLVADYQIGYFKFDYNINVTGNDRHGDAPGAGLLGHNRAYLDWLDGLLDRHPGLVLESCSSGGMRLDYAMLARMSVHSTSDQVDHRTYASIAAAAPSAVTPEQGAVWAYPQPEHTPEQASFCLVNALLGRVHLSGRIDLMSGEQRARVAEALRVYKDHRSTVATGRPHWPLGLPGWYDDWLALAIVDNDCLLSVWHRGESPADTVIPLPPGCWRSAQVVFPKDLGTDLTLARDGTSLRVSLPSGPAARLIRLAR